jgi:hypothetical protein
MLTTLPQELAIGTPSICRHALTRRVPRPRKGNTGTIPSIGKQSLSPILTAISEGNSPWPGSVEYRGNEACAIPFVQLTSLVRNHIIAYRENARGVDQAPRRAPADRWYKTS